MQQVLNGVIYALCGVIVWLALAHRRALAFPRWAYEKLPARPRGREILQGVGVFVFLVLLQFVPDAIRLQTNQEPTGFFGPGFLYIVYLLGGWIAGRFGGRYGIAAAMTSVLLPALIYPVSIPFGLFMIEGSAQKAQVFVQRVLEDWSPVLQLTPQALVFTLTAAMGGAWSAYGNREDHPSPPEPARENAPATGE
jgi:hypothetical protein